MRRRGADVRPIAVRLTAKVLSGRKDLPNTVLSGRKDLPNTVLSGRKELLLQSSATARVTCVTCFACEWECLVCVLRSSMDGNARGAIGDGVEFLILFFAWLRFQFSDPTTKLKAVFVCHVAFY